MVAALPGLVQLATVTLLYALSYWDTVGRPRLSEPALWAASIFAVAILFVTSYHERSISSAEWLAIAPFAGIVFGTSLAASETGRTVLGYATVPA